MEVKRLEEERDKDQSSNEPHGGPDLDTDVVKTNLRLPNPAASDDRESRSLNESNSTSKKDDARQNDVVKEEKPITVSVKIKKTGPARTGDEPGREWSLNGAAAEPKPKPKPKPELEPEAEKDRRAATVAAAGGGKKRREKERSWGNSKGSETVVGDSNEGWESVSESKQEGKEGGAVSKQQSSDVQSSGSLSQQRKRCRNSSGDEPEVSPAKPKPKPKAKTTAHKSEPLLKFLEIIRSHRLGSAFERRLRSQVR